MCWLQLGTCTSFSTASLFKWWAVLGQLFGVCVATDVAGVCLCVLHQYGLLLGRSAGVVPAALLH